MQTIFPCRHLLALLLLPAYIGANAQTQRTIRSRATSSIGEQLQIACVVLLGS